MKKVSQLKKIQASFADYIYANNDSSILPEIIADGVNEKARLQIYKDNVLINLTESLKSKYPVICKLVSEKFFNYAASEFIKKHPPITGNVEEHGEKFSDFLISFEPVKNLAYLPDIAKIEWARHVIYFASNSPAEYVFSSEYPLDKIFDFVENYSEDKQPPAITKTSMIVKISRPGFKVETKFL